MTFNQNKATITYLRPAKGLAALNLRDLWDYRELIYFLTWRDLKVRYKQTILGFTWVMLQPVINMVVFTILFGQLLKCANRRHSVSNFFICRIAAMGLFRWFVDPIINHAGGQRQSDQ